MTKFNFQEIMNSDEALLKWLQHLEIFGVCLIDQVPDSLNQVGSLANKVGFIKRTHYG
jgi:gamma-butyrobetaine dioxygenase